MDKLDWIAEKKDLIEKHELELSRTTKTINSLQEMIMDLVKQLNQSKYKKKKKKKGKDH